MRTTLRQRGTYKLYFQNDTMGGLMSSIEAKMESYGLDPDGGCCTGGGVTLNTHALMLGVFTLGVAALGSLVGRRSLCRSCFLHA